MQKIKLLVLFMLAGLVTKAQSDVNSRNLTVQRNLRLASYPSTRVDTNTVTNVLFTDANGFVKSVPLSGLNFLRRPELQDTAAALRSVLATKQNLLTPGSNITIAPDGTISANGGEGGTSETASQGLSKTGSDIQLGNTVGTTSAQLTSNREIPLNTFGLRFTEGSARMDLTKGKITVRPDSTVSGGGTSGGTFLQVDPIHPRADAVPFIFSRVATQQHAGATSPNEVVMWGHNLTGGGAALLPGLPGLGYSLESNYQPSAGTRYVEGHKFYVTPAGTQVRLESHTINTSNNDIDFYKTNNREYTKDLAGNIWTRTALEPAYISHSFAPPSSASYEWLYDNNGVQLSMSTPKPLLFGGASQVNLPSAVFTPDGVDFSKDLTVTGAIIRANGGIYSGSNIAIGVYPSEATLHVGGTGKFNSSVGALSFTATNPTSNDAATLATTNNAGESFTTGVTGSDYVANSFIGASSGYQYTNAPGGLATVIASPTGSSRLSIDNVERSRVESSGGYTNFLHTGTNSLASKFNTTNGYNYTWDYSDQGVQFLMGTAAPLYFNSASQVQLPSLTTTPTYVEISQQLVPAVTGTTNLGDGVKRWNQFFSTTGNFTGSVSGITESIADSTVKLASTEFVKLWSNFDSTIVRNNGMFGVDPTKLPRMNLYIDDSYFMGDNTLESPLGLDSNKLFTTLDLRYAGGGGGPVTIDSTLKRTDGVLGVNLDELPLNFDIWLNDNFLMGDNTPESPIALDSAKVFGQVATMIAAGGGGGEGTGTVTSFSAGDLAPLFTTTEATATTTPALSFALSSAAPHTFLGNNTGSAGTPAYSSITVPDLPVNIPNANLQYAYKNFTVGGSGSDAIAWSNSPVYLGGTANLNIQMASTATPGVLGIPDYNRSYIRQVLAVNPTGTITYNVAAGGQQTITFTSAGARTLSYTNLRDGDLVGFTFINNSGSAVELTLPANSFVAGVGAAATVSIPTGRSVLSLVSYDGTESYYSLQTF